MHRMLWSSLFLALPAAARAGTATNLITGVGYPTLQLAIDAAAPGDTVELDGDFDESVVVDRDLDLVGAAGAHLHSDAAEVIYVNAGVKLTVDGVDLTADAATRVVNGASGAVDLTLRDARVEAAPVYAGIDGGVVYLVNPVRLELDQVTMVGFRGAEVASYGAVYVGGASAGAVDVKDSSFTDLAVTGFGGGAIYTTYASVSCERCVFDHAEGGWGGAISASYGSLVVRDSVFSGCSGSLGGAVYVAGDAEVTNSVFVENDATVNGAAVFANDGAITLRNNHFLGKGAGQAPSEVFAGSAVDALEVRNNLFFRAPAAALAALAGPDPIATYNYFAENGSDADVPLDPTNVLSSADPQLVAWTDNGVLAGDDYRPQPVTSPLLDAGDPMITDPDGSRSDIGAYGGALADPALFEDLDGDGASAPWDCDDGDAAVTDVVFYPDCDGDGQGLPSGAPVGCLEPADPPAGCAGGGWASALAAGDLAAQDCDDADPTVFVGAPETCAVADQDCDGDPYAGAIDAESWYLDLDGDRFGDVSFADCAGSLPGWVHVGGDCDDFDGEVFPGAADACGDYVDQDCDGADGTEDERTSYYTDADGDGYGDPGAAPVSECPGTYPDGLAANGDDCDDGDATVRPGAFDTCDGVDQDCNGLPDDGPPIRTWYRDQDADGRGGDVTKLSACSPGDDWALAGGDCDDRDADTLRCRAVEQDAGCGCATSTPSVPWLAAFLLPLLALRRAHQGGLPC